MLKTIFGVCNRSGYFDGNEKSKRAQEKCGYRHHHIEENKTYALMNDIRTEHISRITKEEWIEFTNTSV